MTLLSIIAANGLLSLISFVSAVLLTRSTVWLKSITYILVSLSAGSLMGAAFWHLLPEAMEETEMMSVLLFLPMAFVMFFIIEKIVHWQHCHKAECDEHSFGYLNLIGDGVHNFIDGLTIAAAFITNPLLGVTTTIAIALHEIPQELGDIGVLIHAGFSRRKALVANVLVALTAVAGGVVGYFLSVAIESYVPYVLTFAAGGFMYIAAVDLVPELKAESSMRKTIISVVAFSVGLAVMYAALFTEHS